jgi:hypothetical protein
MEIGIKAVAEDLKSQEQLHASTNTGINYRIGKQTLPGGKNAP